MTNSFEAMRSVLERHGGSVEKFIGDAVVAVFGVPKVHEDVPLRAVRAAAEMRTALADLNEGQVRESGVGDRGSDRDQHRGACGRGLAGWSEPGHRRQPSTWPPVSSKRLDPGRS
jgi:hypothetical protein